MSYAGSVACDCGKAKPGSTVQLPGGMTLRVRSVNGQRAEERSDGPQSK
jgi:hypothetical protein